MVISFSYYHNSKVLLNGNFLHFWIYNLIWCIFSNGLNYQSSIICNSYSGSGYCFHIINNTDDPKLQELFCHELSLWMNIFAFPYYIWYSPYFVIIKKNSLWNQDSSISIYVRCQSKSYFMIPFFGLWNSLLMNTI